MKMSERESDDQRFARENIERQTRRIDELSRDAGGLGPGDIVQIARREAERRREEYFEIMRHDR